MKFRTITYSVKTKSASKAAFIIKGDLTKDQIKSPVVDIVVPILQELIVSILAEEL